MVSALLSGTEERTGHEEEGVVHGEGIVVKLRISAVHRAYGISEIPAVTEPTIK